MKKLLLFFILPCISCVLFLQCGNSNRHFPTLINIDRLKQTEFLPTLQHTVSPGKNTIYTPAFLFAWDLLRNKLKEPIVTDSCDAYLKLVNSAENYSQTLDKSEIEKDINFTGNEVQIHASFMKSLSFKTALEGDLRLQFNKTLVHAFGMANYNENMASQISILYYKNNDEFIIRIVPAEAENYIILSKGINEGSNLDSTIAHIDAKIEHGKAEKDDTTQSWKYYITDEDKIMIPVLKFNIEANYPAIAGRTIASASGKFEITDAKQITAFVFDEFGAIVKSEAEVTATTDSTDSEAQEIKHDKMMFFDKPFILLITKSSVKKPYLVIKVSNSELMAPIKL